MMVSYHKKLNNIQILFKNLKKLLILENMKIDFDEFARVMARNYYKKHNREDLVEAFK
jgi:Ca2+-binding EF-hand superfamily protein